MTRLKPSITVGHLLPGRPHDRKSFFPIPFLLIATLIMIASSAVQSRAAVVISEIMASNGATILDEDGDSSDWLELFNDGATPVNLEGWYLTDDPNEMDLWRLPAVEIESKGFLMIWASGKDRRQPDSQLHTNFKLSSAGGYLALVGPDGVTPVFEFAEGYPPQRRDYSYGPSQDVSETILLPRGADASYHVPAGDQLGTSWIQPDFDDSSWDQGPAGIGYESAIPGFAYQMYRSDSTVSSLSIAADVAANPELQSSALAGNVEVINYVNNSGSAHFGDDSAFPGLDLSTDYDNYVLEAFGTVRIPTAGAWSFGVNSDDGFLLQIGPHEMSWPDPRGPADTIETFQFNEAGDYQLYLLYYEQGGGAEVELFAAEGAYSEFDGSAFRLVGDTASGGLEISSQVISEAGQTVELGIGSAIGTDILTEMQGINSTAYVRFPFDLADPSSVQALDLSIQYDDGFIAFLNGTEVARSNAPSTPTWNSAAVEQRPNESSIIPESFNLTGNLDLLVAGANVLAVHGLNVTAEDTDFLIHPELVEYEATSSAMRYFDEPTPGTYNTEGFNGFVDDPDFSHDHGFYDTAFNLAITTETAGATIWYTLGGSTPIPGRSLEYSGPIQISGTTIVRAVAVLDGYLPSRNETASYLFVDDIVQQSPNGQAPPGWPSSWGSNTVDYGMDPQIVNHTVYGQTIREDLKSIPSFSLVTDLPNLFDPTTGIYANPGQDGRLWERPVSVEYIIPDGSKEGFQVDAGIRIRGGFSRSTGNPKHAFRLFFRSEYGEPKLRYPLFGDRGTDTFDALDLRTFQNYSWSFQGDSRGIFIRDQLNRDMQLAMGHQGERGDFCHLYINGQYWGLFNTCERPEASYGETYFGGDKENYDVIKVEAGSYTINATDGNLLAWRNLWSLTEAGMGTDAAFQQVLGNNPDGTPNPDYPVYLELNNLIDYMLIIYYGGNLDAPISNFLGNTSPNNFYGVRDRTGDAGFRFFVHDAEHTLLNVNENRTGPFPAGSTFYKSNPQRMFQQLMAHPEFNLMVADRIQKHFFNGGVLTPEGATALLDKRYDEIYSAVVAESARWGDAKRSSPLTRDQEWAAEMNRVRNDFIVRRTDIVLNQLRAKGLYPSVDAPSLNIQGGNVEPDTTLTMSAPSGTIFYTIDGTDPRLPGGSLSPSAKRYSSPLTIQENFTLKCRVRSGSTWSALNEADFLVIQDFTELAITEIMYHPTDDLVDDIDGNEFEFLELKNLADVELDLSGVHFSEGISFTFPNGTRLAPGEFVVLTSNSEIFLTRYPSVTIGGIYEGRLDNAGERITLVHAVGTVITSVRYNDRTPWPLAADGEGFSLVRRDPNLVDEDVDSATAWRASAEIDGSPGRDDPVPAGFQVIVNEILSRPAPGGLDAIELFNPEDEIADIGGWFLTDDRNDPRKYRIALGTNIPGGGYLVLDETSFNADPGAFGNFGLSSMGEEIYLFSGDQVGALTGYSHGFSFEASEEGTTWGRYIISTGGEEYTALASPSFGDENSGPKVGPVVISEIYFHPRQGTVEFVELQNITDQPVPLYDPNDPAQTWHVEGLGFDFPVNTTIPANGIVLVVATTPDAFLADNPVPNGVQVFGPYSGILQDNGELLSLQKPWDGEVPAGETPARIPVDSVRYRITAPWPVGASGTGLSLERLVPAEYGNDPANWRVSPDIPSPGLDNLGNRPPQVDAGPDQEMSAVQFPLQASVSAVVTDDGQPLPVTHKWTMLSGPGPVIFEDDTQTSTNILLPGAGDFELQLTSSDGDLQNNDTLRITVLRPSGDVTFIPAGSDWKYLDKGIAAPATWTEVGFNDDSWDSGPAQLGYGDGDEQTTVDYGPNAQQKYRTTYFRRTFHVAGASAVSDLVVRLLRDDGALVYLNGEVIFRSNMPDDPVTFDSYSAGIVGGSEESTFYSNAVDSVLLREGDNVLAVEVHQCNDSSSDLSFDLELSGTSYPVNSAPTVNAGLDATTELGTPITLAATFTDDGLPLPPGAPSFSWTRISGPGTVQFSPQDSPVSTVGFSQAGEYILELTVDDSEFTASDQLTVTVIGADEYTQWKMQYFTAEELLDPDISGDDADPDGDGFTNKEEFQAGTDPRNAESRLHFTDVKIDETSPGTLQLTFEAAADRSYSVLYSDRLSDGIWNILENIPAESEARIVTIEDSPDGIGTRFYTIVTPMRP